MQDGCLSNCCKWTSVVVWITQLHHVTSPLCPVIASLQEAPASCGWRTVGGGGKSRPRGRRSQGGPRRGTARARGARRDAQAPPHSPEAQQPRPSWKPRCWERGLARVAGEASKSWSRPRSWPLNRTPPAQEHPLDGRQLPPLPINTTNADLSTGPAHRALVGTVTTQREATGP